MGDPQAQVVFNNTQGKEFKDLTDHEKYYRTQYHIDEVKDQMAKEQNPAKRSEMQEKIDKLKNARDQWQDAR